MELVLLGLHIVLKEHFNPVIHLWTNVFEEETGDDGYNTECHRRQSNVPDDTLTYDFHRDGEGWELPDSRRITLDKCATGCSRNGCC